MLQRRLVEGEVLRSSREVDDLIKKGEFVAMLLAVIRELKLRGLAKRILVVAPKGLTPQWQAEMQLHFGEIFRIADPGDFDAVSRWSDDDNVWRAADQVICPLDSVKPLARRRGWSWERIAAYNQRRFEDLITAGWDLVVIDEAHRLGGSTDQVARYKLGAALADATPNLLLLSATPHSGKSDQFLRLMQLLDREAFPGEDCTVEHRVREVLEAKLEAIAEEFGANKAADVMDSVEAEAMFDGLYIDGILSPDAVEQRADATLEELRSRIAADRERRDLLGSETALDPGAAQRWRRHPIHFWVEKAVTAGLPDVGGSASRDGETWRLSWPDGSTIEKACFDASGVEATPDATWLTLDNVAVRAMIDDLPPEPPGRRVPQIIVSQLPSGVEGSWSLWRIRMSTARGEEQRYMPLFVQNGRAFAPTARRLWDMIVAGDVATDGAFVVDRDPDLERLAEAQAEPIYLELRDRHRQQLHQERQRVDAAFEARRRAVGRIGLENVRRARMRRLEDEHRQRIGEIDAAASTMPSLEPLTLAEVRST